MLFTTSWDDGYNIDMRLASMLEKYDCKGTFYICPRIQHDQTMLSEQDIQKLRDKHEIGAHTLRHPKLTEISESEAREEIVESKKWVESMSEVPCKMFCYPYGMHSSKIEEIVMQAGFKGARTTKDLQFTAGSRYAMPVSFQVKPFPKRKTWSRWWHPLDPFGPARVTLRRATTLGVPLSAMNSWLSFVTALFDMALTQRKPVFHLWGHSYEIDKYNMWNDLEKFLGHVQSSKVECVVNSATLH